MWSQLTNNSAVIYAAGGVSRNPATDELIATYPYQTPEEVEGMLRANAAAFRVWRDIPMGKRVAAYHRLAAALRDRSESLAAIITAEKTGSAIGAARRGREQCRNHRLARQTGPRGPRRRTSFCRRAMIRCTCPTRPMIFALSGLCSVRNNRNAASPSAPPAQDVIVQPSV